MSDVPPPCAVARIPTVAISTDANAATRRAGRRGATVAVDVMAFHPPAFIGTT